MDQKRIDQIKESLAEFYAYYCDGAGHPLNICADQDMRQLIVEIERLRAIVAKLLHVCREARNDERICHRAC